MILSIKRLWFSFCHRFFSPKERNAHLYWMEETSDAFFSSLHNVTESVTDKMSAVGYDQPHYKNIVLLDQKHWTFMPEWTPTLNREILEWLRDQGIEEWTFRQTPWKGSGSMCFQIEFFHPSHATLFKLRWL